MDFNRHTQEEEDEEEEETGTQLTSENSVRMNGASGYRYGECLKNHAVGIGKQAVDGCREFMAAGDEGTLEALKCAACNCHRNFHRKVHKTPPATYYYHHQMRPAGYLHVSSHHHHQPPLALPATSRDNLEDQISNPSSSGGGSKKRFRTKFTDYQKERMLPFAEGLGWRIQKEDEAAVQQFCHEIGIKRKVLKVWMHNNKNTLERDDDDDDDEEFGRRVRHAKLRCYDIHLSPDPCFFINFLHFQTNIN